MAITLDSSSLVTIFGGSGFLGRHVVQALARTGCRMRIAVRRPDLAGFLQPLGSVGQIHAVQANVRYPDSVDRAMAGSDAVINLVGILYPTGKQRFESVHDEGAGAIARAVKAHGIDTLVHVSAIGADADSPSVYARTKAAGEKAVLKACPGAVILRPSVVFGPEDEFFNRFASMARFAPVLPLFGGGKTKFQPVYCGDVAKAVVAALSGGCKPGSIYELGGPEVLTLRQVFEKVLQQTGRRRLLVPVPFGLAKLKASVLQLLPKPPLTLDQVRLLQRDNLVSGLAYKEKRTLEGLGIDPVPADAVIGNYLVQYRARGEFAAVKA